MWVKDDGAERVAITSLILTLIVLFIFYLSPFLFSKVSILIEEDFASLMGDDHSA